MTMTLPVTVRGESQNLKQLRANGQVPAVLYGRTQEAVSLAIDAKVFKKTLQEAGESTIITLTGLPDEAEVLIKKVEFSPVKTEIQHVDLYAIERGKEMTTKVAIHFTGESPAEVSKLGVVNKVLHEVDVTCLPKNLPSELLVDVTTLAALDDKILIKDLKLPEGVKIEAEEEDMVAGVNSISEEPEETEMDMDAVEVEQKGGDSESDADGGTND